MRSIQPEILAARWHHQSLYYANMVKSNRRGGAVAEEEGSVGNAALL